MEDQLARHLALRAAVAGERHGGAKDALSSAAAFEARRRRLREFFRAAVGGLPEMPPRVPATCTGVLEQDGFRVELLLLETLPGVLATANLYVPHGRRDAARRGPAVLFLCGHAREAKAYGTYQRVCRALVRRGLVVLALDPWGQGERMQYVDPESGALTVEWGTEEHAHVGLQCHVAGFGLARYFLADAMQAVTYLRERPEVDPARIGVTGNSGGGTQSSYLIFYDERLACGAPCTYLTSRAAYMSTGQAHDSEQNIHGALAEGLDHDDLASGLAPRPLMLGAVASDYFCIEGTLATFERLRRIYRLYGAEDQLYLTVGPGPHGYSDVLRDRVCAFFRRHLLGEEVELAPGLASYAAADESPLPPRGARPEAEDVLPPERLNVTRRGQVVLEHPAARRIFDLNLEAWRGRARTVSRGGADGRARLRAWVLGPRRCTPLWVRQVRSGTVGGIWWAHRYLFAEPGIAVPMIELRRADLAAEARAPMLVAALDDGTPAVAARAEEVRRLVAEAGRVLLFDARGTGAAAQRPVNARPPLARFGTLYKLNYDAMMLGDSLLAMMAFDSLRVLEYAGRVAAEVRLLGEGVPGLALLMGAGASAGALAGGEFRGLPASFDDLVTDRLAAPDPRLEVFGLTDLPDVRDMLDWVGGRRDERRDRPDGSAVPAGEVRAAAGS